MNIETMHGTDGMNIHRFIMDEGALKLKKEPALSFDPLERVGEKDLQEMIEYINKRQYSQGPAEGPMEEIGFFLELFPQEEEKYDQSEAFRRYAEYAVDSLLRGSKFSNRDMDYAFSAKILYHADTVFAHFQAYRQRMRNSFFAFSPYNDLKFPTNLYVLTTWFYDSLLFSKLQERTFEKDFKEMIISYYYNTVYSDMADKQAEGVRFAAFSSVVYKNPWLPSDLDPVVENLLTQFRREKKWGEFIRLLYCGRILASEKIAIEGDVLTLTMPESTLSQKNTPLPITRHF